MDCQRYEDSEALRPFLSCCWKEDQQPAISPPTRPPSQNLVLTLLTPPPSSSYHCSVPPSSSFSQAPGAVYKPTHGPKTCAGAVFSIICVAFVGILWGYFSYQFFRPDNTWNINGDDVMMNDYDCHPPGSAKQLEQLRTRELAVIDLPSMVMTVHNTLTFYEEKTPSLQRVVVIDATGYNPYYASTDDIVPQVSAVYQSLSVPLNSFDERFSPFSAPNSAATIDANELIAVQSGHLYTAESMKMMYGLNNLLAVENDKFFPHTTHVYARFKREQMEQVKKCQLQVQLANSGVLHALDKLDVLGDRAFHTSDHFPTLTTDGGWTWEKEHFVLNGEADAVGSSYAWLYGLEKDQCLKVMSDAEQCHPWDILHISNHFSTEAYNSFTTSTTFGPNSDKNIKNLLDTKKVKVSDFRSWNLGVTYVNNMVKKSTFLTCGGANVDRFIANFALATPLPLGSSDGSATISSVEYNFGDSFEGLVPPLYVLLTSLWGREVVKVTAFDEAADTITVVRGAANGNNGKRIDHTKRDLTYYYWLEIDKPAGIDPVADPAMTFDDIYRKLYEAPSAWTCAEDDYFMEDGVCDCECGTYDPDCGTSTTPMSSINGCTSGSSCSLDGKCIEDFELFSLLNTDVEPYSAFMAVSVDCTFVTQSGTDQIIGYVGSLADFTSKSGYSVDGSAANAVDSCGSCPGDPLYNNAAQKTDDGEYVCNYAAHGDVKVAEADDINAIVGNKKDTGSVTFRVYAKSTKFPVVEMDMAPTVPVPLTGKQYKVTVGDGDGNREVLDVIKTTAPNSRGVQSITVSKKKGTKRAPKYLRPNNNHVSAGVLLGAVSASSDKIYVVPADPGPDGHLALSFDSRGPYNIKVGDQIVSVSGASTFSENLIYQELRLATSVEKTIGTIANIAKDAAYDATEVYIRAVGFGKQAIKDKLLTGDVSYGLIHNGLDVDIVVITGVDASDWTCPFEFFNDGFKCHCNCGIYDPDCGDPSVLKNEMVCFDPAKDPWDQDDTAGYCDYVQSASDVESDYSYNTNACVNLADGGTAPLSTSPLARDTVDRFVEKITLSKGLRNNVAAGSVFESNTYYDEEYEEVVSDVEVASTFEVSMYRLDQVFDPEKRFMANLNEAVESPQALDVDVSIYIVPDRKTFKEIDLCPKLSTAEKPDFKWDSADLKKWTVKKDRVMTIACDPKKEGTEGNGMAEVNTDTPADACLSPQEYADKFQGQYRKACLDSMPPSYTYSYDVVKPVNKIWDIDWEKAQGGISKMVEFEMELETIYHFSHHGIAENVENDMSAHGRSDGEYDQDGNNLLFFGAPDYRDVPKSGMGRDIRAPANLPYLSSKITIDATAYAAKEVVDCKPKYWPWDQKLAQNIIAKFKQIEVEFEFEKIGGQKGSFLLEPGYKYRLIAEIAIYPTYKKYQYFDIQYITGFKSVVIDNEVFKTKQDEFSKNEARIIYEITIDDSLQQSINAHKSSVDIIMGQFGASIAYLGIGLLLLRMWQKATGQTKKMAEWAAENNTPEKREESEGGFLAKKVAFVAAAVEEEKEEEE